MTGRIMSGRSTTGLHLSLYTINEIMATFSDYNRHHPTDRIIQNTVFIIPVVKNWLEHSEQAVVAHACHGHRFLCPGQEKKRGRRSKGGPSVLAGTREYEQSGR